MRIALSLGLAALLLTASFAGADDKDKPKMTIKEVMKVVAKDKLLAKVTDDKGTAEDKKKLLEAFEGDAFRGHNQSRFRGFFFVGVVVAHVFSVGVWW